MAARHMTGGQRGETRSERVCGKLALPVPMCQGPTQETVIAMNERMGAEEMTRAEIEQMWRHQMRPETCQCGQHD